MPALSVSHINKPYKRRDAESSTSRAEMCTLAHSMIKNKKIVVF